MKFRFSFLGLILFLAMNMMSMAQNPMRIVSLAPSLTQNLYFLGVENQVVGVTSYCEIAKNDNKEQVASAIKVNIEKVVAMKPDLVVTTALTEPETIAMLRKFGLKVEVFGKVHSFDEICEQFLNLGILVNRKKEAESIVGQTILKVEKLRRSVTNAIAPRIFFQIGAKPIFTVVSETFMDDYIRFAGGVNIAADIKNPSMTRESVVVRNPDVIIIVTMGMLGDEEKKVWESYKNLNAVKNKKVFIIDADKACTPTPLTFAESLEEIIRLIYATKK